MGRYFILWTHLVQGWILVVQLPCLDGILDAPDMDGQPSQSDASAEVVA